MDQQEKSKQQNISSLKRKLKKAMNQIKILKSENKNLIVALNNAHEYIDYLLEEYDIEACLQDIKEFNERDKSN